ncbi:jg13658 [Pararge aegeria aegeria]|uniref:Jg13658 protein n=1 Tax=Pararge aegeria aegeria TaxID=348720 RepID=A0A8S4S8I3_9NEOP|nr:jg13658 [Pararge aegeria aegeria]
MDNLSLIIAYRKSFDGAARVASSGSKLSLRNPLTNSSFFLTAIGKAEDAQVILENCLDKDTVYKFLRPWLGQGLFIAPLGLWKNHRRVLLPVFHNKVVEEYLQIISDQANILLERLAEESGKREFDVLRYITACTLDVVFDGRIKTVLDMLFGREIDFTDEQLREHIDSITIAGNDTTALVIAYTLVLLGIHQDAQERVFEEQQSIFKNSKQGATKEDLRCMNYLERVIKESMRLYTVVPIIARNVDKEIYLPHSKVTIPVGVGAVVGAFAIHRSVDEWGSNANEFDPDRFLPERSDNRHPAAFIPFSYGSRNCIGRNFGMLIMKSIISSIIRTYKIEANEVGPLKIEVLLFPIRGHQVKITKR